MVPTEEAKDAVNTLGLVGTLAAVILMLVVALLWVVKSIRTDSATAAHYSQKAEHAVNGVGEEEHRLFDKVHMIQGCVEKLVAADEDFAKKGWLSLPPDISTASSLTSTIRDLQQNDRNINSALERIEKTLNHHIHWEETIKYRENHGRYNPNSDAE
jgi:hypothetical protein